MNDIRPIEGRAWGPGAPASFSPPGPALEREKDLFEGFAVELESGYLPFDSTHASGALHGHMAARGFHGVECGVVARFQLPPSPRCFVFDQLLERVLRTARIGDYANEDASAS